MGVIAALPAGGRRSAISRFVERWSWAMGQRVHVMLYADSEDRGLEAAAAALAELRRVEDVLSNFDDASDVSEVNRMAGRKAVAVHDDVVTMVEVGTRIGGGFTLGIERLMHSRSADALAAVRASRIRCDGRRVSVTTPIDSGGIGVGHGLDCAARVLRRHGITKGFIDVSGDCIAIGGGWDVGIARPGNREAVVRTVRLEDEALATSSNFESWHVIDPATGEPVPRTRQATIIARRGIHADACSTAALLANRIPDGVRGWIDHPEHA